MNKNKLIREIKFCKKTDSYYLEATFKDETIYIFENQRYLIEWILLQFRYPFNSLKKLYSKCLPENFHLYIFAYNYKSYVKSIMFSYWKSQKQYRKDAVMGNEMRRL